jgi:hypothetical protein
MAKLVELTLHELRGSMVSTFPYDKEFFGGLDDKGYILGQGEHFRPIFGNLVN